MIAPAGLHPCQDLYWQIAIGWRGQLGHRSFLSPDRAIIFLVGSGQWPDTDGSGPLHLHFRALALASRSPPFRRLSYGSPGS